MWIQIWGDAKPIWSCHNPNWSIQSETIFTWVGASDESCSPSYANWKFTKIPKWGVGRVVNFGSDFGTFLLGFAFFKTWCYQQYSKVEASVLCYFSNFESYTWRKESSTCGLPFFPGSIPFPSIFIIFQGFPGWVGTSCPGVLSFFKVFAVDWEPWFVTKLLAIELRISKISKHNEIPKGVKNHSCSKSLDTHFSFPVSSNLIK